MSAKVMIVVTHLLGTGHLARALTLGRAFAAEGCETHVVSGGFPVPHLDAAGIHLHQLPALRANGTDFKMLLDAEDQPASANVHSERQRILTALLEQIRPDVLITELFPFGRRNLRNEFRALLGAVRPPTQVFCSIRDVLNPPSKPAKAQFAEQIIASHYDAVLVHADPKVITLSQSWPVTDALETRLRYTGFVAPAPPNLSMGPRDGDFIVSAGGGDVGAALFETALRAAKGHPKRWRILVASQVDLSELTLRAPDNVTIEHARPDFRDLLAKAAASVSMCGYNTAMDVMQTGVPAVIVPFDDANEVEQTLRAEALQKLSGVEVVASQDLTPDALRDALTRVLQARPRDVSGLCFDGARETVRICLEAAP